MKKASPRKKFSFKPVRSAKKVADPCSRQWIANKYLQSKSDGQAACKWRKGQAKIAGSREVNSSLVSLRVKGLNEPATFSLPEVLVMTDWPDVSSSMPRDSQLRSYKHLHGLRFPEVSESCIGLLIGAGAVQVHSVVDARVGRRRNQPTAFRNRCWLGFDGST